MAPFYGYVSDHFEIDDADADLRVKNPLETIDNRVFVDQILPLIEESLLSRSTGRYLHSLSLTHEGSSTKAWKPVRVSGVTFSALWELAESTAQFYGVTLFESGLESRCLLVRKREGR